MNCLIAECTAGSRGRWCCSKEEVVDGAILQQSADGTLQQIINLCWMPFLLRHFHGIKSSAIVYAQGSLQDTKTTGSITTVNSLAQGFEDLAVLTRVTAGASSSQRKLPGFLQLYKKKKQFKCKSHFLFWPQPKFLSGILRDVRV